MVKNGTTNADFKLSTRVMASQELVTRHKEKAEDAQYLVSSMRRVEAEIVYRAQLNW